MVYPGRNTSPREKWYLTILEYGGPIQLDHSLVGILILLHVAHDAEPQQLQQREDSLP